MLNYDFSDPTEDLINEGLRVIQSDYDEVLGVADDYLHGRFADPYSPKGLTGEQRAMMRKAKLNWCEIPVEAATQVLLVDGFRPGEQQVAGPDGILEEEPPEWDLRRGLRSGVRCVGVGRLGAWAGESPCVVGVADGLPV